MVSLKISVWVILMSVGWGGKLDFFCFFLKERLVPFERLPTKLYQMRLLLLSLILMCEMPAIAQKDTLDDLTGTWEGTLTSDGSGFEGIQRNFRIRWELVQVKLEVFGIVYFYPQDTRPGDKPNAWYSWYGKMGKVQPFPFQFIQGRYIDGLGTSNIYQFNVQLNHTDTGEVVRGNYYYTLESLKSRERPAGYYTLHKVSSRVSDQLWLKRKEKAIMEKLEQDHKENSRR